MSVFVRSSPYYNELKLVGNICKTIAYKGVQVKKHTRKSVASLPLAKHNRISKPHFHEK